MEVAEDCIQLLTLVLAVLGIVRSTATEFVP
jgi:hypothetical protein